MTKDKGDDGYIVLEVKYDHFGDPCTLKEEGDKVPIYCNKCTNLLTYSINE